MRTSERKSIPTIALSAILALAVLVPVAYNVLTPKFTDAQADNTTVERYSVQNPVLASGGGESDVASPAARISALSYVYKDDKHIDGISIERCSIPYADISENFVSQVIRNDTAKLRIGSEIAGWDSFDESRIDNNKFYMRDSIFNRLGAYTDLIGCKTVNTPTADYMEFDPSDLLALTITDLDEQPTLAKKFKFTAENYDKDISPSEYVFLVPKKMLAIGESAAVGSVLDVDYDTNRTDKTIDPIVFDNSGYISETAAKYINGGGAFISGTEVMGIIETGHIE